MSSLIQQQRLDFNILFNFFFLDRHTVQSDVTNIYLYLLTCGSINSTYKVILVGHLILKRIELRHYFGCRSLKKL